MVRNDDGSITLNEDDIVGLRALVVAAQSGLTYKGAFTSEDAARFVHALDEVLQDGSLRKPYG